MQWAAATLTQPPRRRAAGERILRQRPQTMRAVAAQLVLVGGRPQRRDRLADKRSTSQPPDIVTNTSAGGIATLTADTIAGGVGQ
jgi:hypothetical protein